MKRWARAGWLVLGFLAGLGFAHAVIGAIFSVVIGVAAHDWGAMALGLLGAITMGLFCYWIGVGSLLRANRSGRGDAGTIAGFTAPSPSGSSPSDDPPTQR